VESPKVPGVPEITWNLLREAKLETQQLDGSQLCGACAALRNLRAISRA
jgi:hypothetical protein